MQLSNEEKQSWPNLVFSDDDTLAFILTTPNEISSYLAQEQFKEFRKFPVSNCEVLSVSPGFNGMFRLAAITPEVPPFTISPPEIRLLGQDAPEGQAEDLQHARQQVQEAYSF